MKMRNVISAAFFVIATSLLLFVACAAEGLAGSGNIVTKDFDFEDFNRLEVHHGFNVNVTRADEFSIELTIDDNLLEYLEVKESDAGLPQVLLRGLLKVQLEIKETYPNITIISDQELMEIRRLWRVEQNDWADQVPKIYQEVTGEQLDWIEDDISSFTLVERQALEDICKRRNIPPGIVTELLDLERQYHGMSRRSDIYKKIDRIFNKEWRTIEEIVN